MKLNPAKCAFKVSVEKLLGFIVNNRGIEANPYKIKAVLDMPLPSNIKEVQRLTRRTAVLSRFVSKVSDKCQPFFQVLKKKAFQWDARCEEAFTVLKTYLSSPPILVSPSEGELLTLYLAASDFSTSIVLVRDKDRVQQLVYYCSRALRGAEERYPEMEKLILTLVTVVDPTRSTSRRDLLLNEKKMWVDFQILENPSPRRNSFSLESPLTFCCYFIKGKTK